MSIGGANPHSIIKWRKYNMATKTKTERLLRVLETGKEVSATQIMKKTGLVNPSSTINRLRNQGLTVYTNKKSNGYVYRAPTYQF
jgi:hypothetical protein